MAVAHARLDGSRDAVHVRDRLDRVLADRRLAREHHRGGAVEDRVRDVARLGARRLGRGATIDSSICVAVITGLPRSSALQDDPLLDQRHGAGPISTPRSPRATITASASARIVVERVDRLGLLDLRDHVRVRAARARSARAGRARRRRERTNESATKSTPSSSANSRSARSLRVSDGIGSGTPGRLTPLCELTTPPTMTAQRARPPLDRRSTRSRTRPSSIRTSWPGLRARRRSPRARSAARRRGDRPRRRRRDDLALARGRRGSRELADAELRPLEVGDQRERPARASPRPRGRDARARACSSCVPCEKLSRAASMPAATSACRTSGGSEAGPSVATISCDAPDDAFSVPPS